MLLLLSASWGMGYSKEKRRNFTVVLSCFFSTFQKALSEEKKFVPCLPADDGNLELGGGGAELEKNEIYIWYFGSLIVGHGESKLPRRIQKDRVLELLLNGGLKGGEN